MLRDNYFTEDKYKTQTLPQRLESRQWEVGTVPLRQEADFFEEYLQIHTGKEEQYYPQQSVGSTT